MTGVPLLFIHKTAKSSSLSNSRTEKLHSDINAHAQRFAKRGPQKYAKHKRVPKPLHHASRIPIGWVARRPPDAIDSVGSPLVKLGHNERSMLHYFVHVWAPSSEYLLLTSAGQVKGILPDNHKLSFNVVHNALHSSDDLSIKSLLGLVANRMQLMDTVERGVPEELALNGVQALRRRFAKQNQPTQQLVMDVMLILLTQFFATRIAPSQLHWQMLRDLIINLGGLQNLDVQTIHTIWGFDAFIAAATITSQSLDPFEYPELLAVDPAIQEPHRRTLVSGEFQNLDARLQFLWQEYRRFRQVMLRVRSLPIQNVRDIMQLLRQNLKWFHGITSLPSHLTIEGAAGKLDHAKAVEIDSTSFSIRMRAYQVWLWYSASRGTCTSTTPDTVLSDVANIWRWMARLELLMNDTGLAVKPSIKLWVSALGWLVTEKLVRDEYASIFCRVASAAQIRSRHDIEEALGTHLPLHFLDPNAIDKLSTLLLPRTGGRVETGSDPSSNGGQIEHPDVREDVCKVEIPSPRPFLGYIPFRESATKLEIEQTPSRYGNCQWRMAETLL
jgi:hypothetical protein